jgi:hypothetical protein
VGVPVKQLFLLQRLNSLVHDEVVNERILSSTGNGSLDEAVQFLGETEGTSSPLMASKRCLGVILFTPWVSETLPASSSTSAVMYSRMAAQQTAEVAPTLLFEVTLSLRNL